MTFATFLAATLEKPVSAAVPRLVGALGPDLPCGGLLCAELEAFLGEILTTAEKADWVCEFGEAALAPEARPTSTAMMHKKAWVEYHPLGVLGVIAPWNYPYHNMYNHIISGLFTGNAVVCKVSGAMCYRAAKGVPYNGVVHLPAVF